MNLFSSSPALQDSYDWLDEGFAHIWLPYAQMQTIPTPLPIIGAEGAKLKLADGRELVDGTSSWWTACHGYNHPHIKKAVTKQLNQFPHVMLGGLAHEPAYTLATRLAEAAPQGLSRVFFSESGSVAVEVALKMALQYWRNKGDAKRNKFICFNGGYHGDTFGTMAISARSDFNQGFDSAITRNYVFDIPRDEYGFAEFEATVKEIRGSVAALIIEPLIQCAGGFLFHSADILSEMRRLCREQDILFIADEIATGFGRTGNMFACNEAAITPDIMCIGKALTGGTMPLAATLTTGEVFAAFLDESWDKALMHGPTYMGNPLACAAANASLDLFESEPRLEQAEKIEQQCWDGLKNLISKPGVRDVRVKGAIAVVEIEGEWPKIARLRQRFIERGVWIRPFGNAVYLMPPLVISEKELAVLTKAVCEELG
jgi:adenosylmethionine-8-amino-7-oxononanoate aminotransferase